MTFPDFTTPTPRTTAGGAPEPGAPTDGGRYRPAPWKRTLAWGAYGLAMLVVIGIALYALL